MKKITTALVLTGASLVSMPIFANGTTTTTPQATDMSAASQDQSPWMVRVRVIDVEPDATSDTIPVIGGKVTDISNDVVPELDINYFFTQHISTELILATTNHDVSATNTSLGKVDLGSVSLLPPTLTAVYHFLPNNKVDPYLGAGINYTHFYNVDDGPTANSVSYDDTWGPALQAGVDVKVSQHFYLNADVKKIYIEPDVTVKALGQTMKTNVDINPWVFGLGVGYRF